MDETNKGKIVYIEDAKNERAKEKITVNEDESVLIVNGEIINLDSFILAGNDKDKNRIVLTYNSSMDEVIVYKETLSVTIQQKLLKQLEDEE